jgi:hypothetical protein
MLEIKALIYQLDYEGIVLNICGLYSNENGHNTNLKVTYVLVTNEFGKTSERCGSN